MRRVTCPVVFAYGPESPQLPIERAREAAKLFSNCRIADVDCSQYWIEAENPATLARVIREVVEE